MLSEHLEKIWRASLTTSISLDEDPLKLYTRSLGCYLAKLFPGQPDVQKILLKECGSSLTIEQITDTATCK